MSLKRQIQILNSKAIHALMLLRNRRIKRHIVVFESDDWGSIRMPSIEAIRRLETRGVKVPLPQSYDSLDTLASNDDLELLMDVLSSAKDVNGKPAKMTLNCCVANPDFERIKKHDYQKYFYELFTETLKRYPNHDRSFALWKEGMAHGVFSPQFHGREHLNPQKWMRWLQENKASVMTAFEENCYAVSVIEEGKSESCLAAYNIESVEECDAVRQSIQEGMEIFEKLFGFRSTSMIAPCYTWDNYIEEEVALNGIICIQGGYIQRHSDWQRSLGKRVTGHFFGEKNHLGQCYTLRNCSFEPSQIDSENADSCFDGIQRAFNWHLPAVVSCHRLNFIGELNKSNRDNNLLEFKRLLKMIVDKYPDVEFMSSDELGIIYLEV